MFERLVASAPPKTLAQSLPGTIVSVAFHAVAIYAAVTATMGAREAVMRATTDTTLVFLAPEAEPGKPEPPPEIRLQQPPGFVALVAPVTIPTNIPPINLRDSFDPRDYTGVGDERLRPEGQAAVVGPQMAYAEAVVDEKPEIISSPPLHYPDILRHAGIEGTVLVEAIIDTTGRAEPASIRIVQSSNAAFEPSAKEVVLKSVYRPGRMYGRPVRVLVNVPVNFSIRKPVA